MRRVLNAVLNLSVILSFSCQSEARPATKKDLQFVAQLLRKAKFGSGITCYLRGNYKIRPGDFSTGKKKTEALLFHFQTKGNWMGLLDMKLAFSPGDEWTAEMDGGFNGELVEKIKISTLRGYSPWIVIEHDGHGHLTNAEVGNIYYNYICARETEYPDDKIDPEPSAQYDELPIAPENIRKTSPRKEDSPLKKESPKKQEEQESPKLNYY